MICALALPIPPVFDAQNAAVRMLDTPWLMGRGGRTGINAATVGTWPPMGLRLSTHSNTYVHRLLYYKPCGEDIIGLR